jgi:hypothetical protein
MGSCVGVTSQRKTQTSDCFKNLWARCHYRPTALRAAALKRKASANRRNDNNRPGNSLKPTPCFRRRYSHKSSAGQVWSWAEATDTLKDLQGIYGIPLDDPASVRICEPWQRLRSW